MTTQRTSGWFIEPIGSHTNEWISKFLAEQQQCSEAHLRQQLDGQGKCHDVIAMPSYDAVRTIIASKANCEFRFNIFVRLKGHRCLSRWTLYLVHKPPKVHLAAAV